MDDENGLVYSLAEFSHGLLDVCATPLIRQLFFNHLGTHEGTLR
jgi:hypothetical protein